MFTVSPDLQSSFKSDVILQYDPVPLTGKLYDIKNGSSAFLILSVSVVLMHFAGDGHICTCVASLPLIVYLDVHIT